MSKISRMKDDLMGTDRTDYRADPIDDERAWQEHELRAEQQERAREYRESMNGETMGHRHEGHMPLFDMSDVERFRTRWSDVQTGFVDDPRTAVEEANTLVGEVTDAITDTFVHHRNELERQWAAGDEASTEELRLALQRYRSFFQRLLNL